MRTLSLRAASLAALAGILIACAEADQTPPAREAPPPGPRFDPSLSDPKAIQLARTLWEAMGGDEGFRRAAYLSFHFVVEEKGKTITDYAHDWDRTTGRYRLEGTLKDGRPFVALFNVNELKGRVYVRGRQVDDFAAPEYLKRFYARFINDTYWLLMPAKLLDPGVILKYEGEWMDPEGETYDIVHLSFQEGTGLSWKDRYWAYINRRTHLMDKWEYILGGSPGEERVVTYWRQWSPHGPLLLPALRVFPDRPIRIFFTDLKVSETVPEEVFTSPARRRTPRGGGTAPPRTSRLPSRLTTRGGNR